MENYGLVTYYEDGLYLNADTTSNVYQGAINVNGQATAFHPFQTNRPVPALHSLASPLLCAVLRAVLSARAGALSMG